MNLTPTSMFILVRICGGDEVLINSFTLSVEELFKENLVYLECPNYLRPTQKGKTFIKQLKMLANRQ